MPSPYSWALAHLITRNSFILSLQFAFCMILPNCLLFGTSTVITFVVVRKKDVSLKCANAKDDLPFSCFKSQAQTTELGVNTNNMLFSCFNKYENKEVKP